MTTNKKKTLQAEIESIALLLEKDVSCIESGPATTKDHYGDYLAIFGSAPEPTDRFFAGILAIALIKAGASLDGVTAAHRLHTGHSLPVEVLELVTAA